MGDVAPCLKATHYKMPPCIVESAGFCTEHSAKSRSIGYEEEVAPTLRAGVTPAVVCKTWDARGNGDGRTANTLTGDHENRITDYTSVVVSKDTVALEGNGQRPSHRGDGYVVTDKSYTLNTTEVHGVAYGLATEASRDIDTPIAIDRAFFNQGKNALYDPQTYEDGTVPTLVAKGPSAVSYGINGDVAGTLDASYYKGCGMRQGVEREVVVTPSKYIVLRLTPTECASGSHRLSVRTAPNCPILNTISGLT